MKKIYQGKYLSVHFNEKESLFVQAWDPSPAQMEDFKAEMLQYTQLYGQYQPANTLWLQQNFQLHLDDEAIFWIEHNVNEPCLAYGNQKCAFVVGKDVLAHLGTIDAFDKTNSCIIPRHFATQEEALRWFKGRLTIESVGSQQKIHYEGIDEEGNVILKVPTKNIKYTLKNLYKSIAQENFIEGNLEKLERLTQREKEILRLVSKKKKQQEIADSLFISIHTFRAHWKNIKRKLEFNSDEEIKIFAKILS